MKPIFRMLRDAGRAGSEFVALLYQRFVVLPRNVRQAMLLVVDLVSIPVASRWLGSDRVALPR